MEVSSGNCPEAETPVLPPNQTESSSESESTSAYLQADEIDDDRHQHATATLQAVPRIQSTLFDGADSGSSRPAIDSATRRSPRDPLSVQQRLQLGGGGHTGKWQKADPKSVGGRIHRGRHERRRRRR